MFNIIKNLIPRRFKINPRSPYNRLRRCAGIARLRYNALRKLIDNNPQILHLFPAEKMLKYYAIGQMLQSIEFPTVYVNQVRLFRIYEFFKNYYPDLFHKETKIIDVGDSSGILFQAMQKGGLSVNIFADVVEAIRKSGIRAQIQDAESLAYNDKSFDYGFCFQCLEHLKNPLRALDELGRVVRKNVFLSIPYVGKTCIHNRNHMREIRRSLLESQGCAKQEIRDASDCHIFEFCAKDFINVLTFTRLQYVDSFPLNFFKPLGATDKNEDLYLTFFILRPKDD